MRFCRRRSKTNPPTTPALVIRKQFLIHFSTPINAHLIITVPEVNYCRVVRKCGRVCLQRHRLALLCETACVCRHGRTNSSCQNYHKCCCEKAAHVDLHLEQGKTKRPSFLMELFSNHHSRKSAAIRGVGSAVMDQAPAHFDTSSRLPERQGFRQVPTGERRSGQHWVSPLAKSAACPS